MTTGLLNIFFISIIYHKFSFTNIYFVFMNSLIAKSDSRCNCLLSQIIHFLVHTSEINQTINQSHKFEVEVFNNQFTLTLSNVNKYIDLLRYMYCSISLNLFVNLYVKTHNIPIEFNNFEKLIL